MGLEDDSFAFLALFAYDFRGEPFPTQGHAAVRGTTTSGATVPATTATTAPWNPAAGGVLVVSEVVWNTPLNATFTDRL